MGPGRSCDLLKLFQPFLYKEISQNWQPLALEMCMGKLHDQTHGQVFPDKYNGRQQGDGLTWGSHQKEIHSAQGGDHKGTTKDKPKGEPLTGNSLNASKTILTNWGSSMSMLVGPMQFGGLPMEVLDWARVEVGTYCCLNKEVASTGSLLFGEFASITASRLMQRPLTWTSLASTQRATTGKLFDRLDRTLTQNSRTRGQLRTNQKESL